MWHLPQLKWSPVVLCPYWMVVPCPLKLLQVLLNVWQEHPVKWVEVHLHVVKHSAPAGRTHCRRGRARWHKHLATCVQSYGRKITLKLWERKHRMLCSMGKNKSYKMVLSLRTLENFTSSVATWPILSPIRLCRFNDLATLCQALLYNFGEPVQIIASFSWFFHLQEWHLIWFSAVVAHLP